jgi:hypothetical protein
LIWSLTDLCPVIVALALVAGLLWKYPVQIAIGSLAVAVGMDCLQLGSDGVNVGISLYPDDAACLIMLGACLVALLRWRRLPRGNMWPLFALCGLAFFNLLRGTIDFGLKAAGNGSRDLFYLVLPSLALMLLRPALRVDNMRRVAKWLIVVGSVLGIVALCRWLGVLPIPVEYKVDDYREVIRALTSDYALLVLDALLAVLYFQIAHGIKWWGLVLGGTFTVLLIFLQHRSVWAAALAALLWFFIRTSQTRRAANFWLIGGGVAMLLMGALVIAAPDEARSTRSLLRTNIEETRSQDSSWEWRVEGYREAVDRVFSSEIGTIVLGPPPGRDLSSVVYASSAHIHDRYINILAFNGLLGETLFLFWLFVVGKEITRRGGPPGAETRDRRIGKVFLQAVFFAELVFFVPYTGGITHGAIIGIIWVLATSSRIQHGARPQLSRERSCNFNNANVIRPARAAQS